MAKHKRMEIVGLIAIIIGGLLVMGGLMFLLTASLAASFKGFLPRVFFIPPVVQIVLGLLASAAGFFLRRGNAAAKMVLLFVAIGVVANVVFLLSLFASLVTQR